MRLLLLVLVALAGLIQYPLWMGRGGWLSVWDMHEHVATQRGINEGLRARNVALLAEIDDLRTGTEASEERARAEMGMMRQGELFVQVLAADIKPPELKPTTRTNRTVSVPVAKPVLAASVSPMGRPASVGATSTSSKPIPATGVSTLGKPAVATTVSAAAQPASATAQPRATPATAVSPAIKPAVLSGVAPVATKPVLATGASSKATVAPVSSSSATVKSSATIQ